MLHIISAPKKLHFLYQGIVQHRDVGCLGAQNHLSRGMAVLSVKHHFQRVPVVEFVLFISITVILKMTRVIKT